MNGYDAYNTYLAMRLHFGSDGYDFFQYHGKARSSESSFNGRKDKYSFHKLARMYDQQKFITLLSVLFCHRDNVYTSDIFGPRAENLLTEDMVWKLSWKTNFLKDLDKIGDFADALRRGEDGSYPKIITLAFQNEISYNTVAILEKNIELLTLLNNKLNGDFIWETYYKKLKKYAPFAFHGVNPVDESGSRIVLLDQLKNNKTK